MSYSNWLHMSGVPDDVGSIVTVGTFDGIHLGHWAILQEISERARATRKRSVLVTFEPHPLKVLRPESAVQSLTTALEKKESANRRHPDRDASPAQKQPPIRCKGLRVSGRVDDAPMRDFRVD